MDRMDRRDWELRTENGISNIEQGMSKSDVEQCARQCAFSSAALRVSAPSAFNYLLKTETFITMKNTTRLIGLLALSAFALGQADVVLAADANPPERMTYQGYLVDGNGAALGLSAPANYDVIFRVYRAKQGGTAIWAEQQTVAVDKGYFSVLLGEGSQYGSELHGDLSAAFDGADASDRFIGITVDINGVATEIAPRLRLVSSPFAYTASQARRLTDGSGNSNFFKDGATLKLGAGSTPTLTLPEAGGASLVGKLTVDLPSWGTGLQIDNGSLTTTIGAQNSGLFHFNTGLPQFYFNKDINVNGNIRSYNTDTILGPSNNTDTHLKISSSSDKITAQADEFLVQGSKYLNIKFTSTAAELKTDAEKIYINNELEVKEKVTASSFVGHGTIPIGGIIMWSGSDEPDGWALCNGQTKDGKTTPDLRNRFIVGSGGEYNNGWTGGQKSVTLTQSQMPSHNHTGTTNKDGAHEHTANGSMNVASGSDGVVVYVNAPASGRHGVIYPRGSEHQHAFTTNATGGSQAHENRPPYYALAYLMRVK